MYVCQECKAFIVTTYKSEKNMLSVNKFHGYISYTPEKTFFIQKIQINCMNILFRLKKKQNLTKSFSVVKTCFSTDTRTNSVA